jgi:WD40 repeat protein
MVLVVGDDIVSQPRPLAAGLFRAMKFTVIAGSVPAPIPAGLSTCIAGRDMGSYRVRFPPTLPPSNPLVSPRMLITADPTQTHVTKTVPHDHPWISCRYDPSGKYAFGGSEDFHVWRVDLENDAKLAYPTNAWVRALVFPEPRTLVTGGYDGRMIWWPVEGKEVEPIREVAAHDGWVRALAVSPDRQLIASCGNDYKVKIWNAADGGLVRELVGHDRDVYNVAFHPNGQDLVSGDLMARFVHWDWATGEQRREFQIETLHKYDTTFRADYGGPYCLRFDESGETLAASGITNVSNAFAAVGNPAVSLIDWAKGEERLALLSKGELKGKAWGLVLHPDGFIIAASGGPGGGHLLFWKGDEKDEFHSLNLGNLVRDLDLHPDGQRLLSCHFDRNLRVSLMGPKT